MLKRGHLQRVRQVKPYWGVYDLHEFLPDTVLKQHIYDILKKHAGIPLLTQDIMEWLPPTVYRSEESVNLELYKMMNEGLLELTENYKWLFEEECSI